MIDLKKITSDYPLEYKFIQDRLASVMKINPMPMYDFEHHEFYNISVKNQVDQIIYNVLSNNDINVLVLIAKLSQAITQLTLKLDEIPVVIGMMSKHSNILSSASNMEQSFLFILENIFIDEVILN